LSAGTGTLLAGIAKDLQGSVDRTAAEFKRLVVPLLLAVAEDTPNEARDLAVATVKALIQ
jgi:hypothetical protein